MFRMSFDSWQADMSKNLFCLCSRILLHHVCVCSQSSYVCIHSSCVCIRVHQFIWTHAPTCVCMQEPYVRIHRSCVCMLVLINSNFVQLEFFSLISLIQYNSHAPVLIFCKSYLLFMVQGLDKRYEGHGAWLALSPSCACFQRVLPVASWCKRLLRGGGILLTPFTLLGGS